MDNNLTIEKAERDKSWNRCINEQQLSHMKHNKTQTCRHWRWKRPVRSSSPSFCQFRIVPWSDVLNFKGKKNKKRRLPEALSILFHSLQKREMKNPNLTNRLQVMED